MGADLTRLPAAEIARRVRGGEVSAAGVAGAFLDRAGRIGPQLNTWITLDREGALRAAEGVDRALAAGEDPGPLCGVPVGLKDLIDAAGLPTTSGSRIDRGRIAREDAPLTRRLRRAGAVVLGKLNLHEFAFGPTGLNPHYGDQKNPWDPERMTGGSSGGAGNAVASGQAALAVGSDTGGSIRIPASLCGTFGHKPTWGLVPKTGCAPLSWSLDTFGPLAMTARDCALMMSALAGYAPGDPSSRQAPPMDFAGTLEGPLEGMRIGLARAYFEGRADPEVAAATERAARAFAEAGAEVRDVEIPDARTAYDAGAVIMVAEAAAAHEKNATQRPADYDPRVIERLRPGFFLPATAYIQALRYRGQWSRRVMDEVFGRVDALLAPATPVPAPLRSARTVEICGREVETRAALISLTRLWNFFGGPATAFPAGTSSAGLPLGAQLMGPPFSDARLLAAVHRLERAGAIAARRPPEGN